MKDTSLNKVYTTLGASNHSEGERQNEDYYASDPLAGKLLLEVEKFAPLIWECACGEGHLSEVFKAAGHKVLSTDLVYRGYGYKNSIDFLDQNIQEFDGDIVTNPPYKYALEFVKKALNCVKDNRKVAMLLRLLFLEGKARREFFNVNPPKTVYVFSARIDCAKNGDFERYKSGAQAYAWFVWEKGYTGDTVIKWIN